MHPSTERAHRSAFEPPLRVKYIVSQISNYLRPYFSSSSCCWYCSYSSSVIPLEPASDFSPSDLSSPKVPVRFFNCPPTMCFTMKAIAPPSKSARVQDMKRVLLGTATVKVMLIQKVIIFAVSINVQNILFPKINLSVLYNRRALLIPN